MAPAKKNQKVAYVVFYGHVPGVYHSWDDAQNQVHGFPGNKYRGYTAAEGGSQRAESEYKDFLDCLPAGRKNGLIPTSQLENKGFVPTVNHLLARQGSTPCAPRTVKRKRASSSGEVLLSKRVVSLSQSNGQGPDAEQKHTASVVGEPRPNNPTYPSGSGGATSTKSRGTDPEKPSKSNVIILDSSEDEEDEALFDDASLDEYLTNNYSTSGPTEPPLCKEQADLVSLIASGRNTFYTGSAGCGKSTVLKAFVKRLRNDGKRVHIVAPTGRAALDINGSTTWTYAGWTPDHMKRPLSILKNNAHGKFVWKRLNSTDVLVIDEISMVENHHFERLNHILKAAHHFPKNPFGDPAKKPFGGIQIVVTGDFCQLPPVRPFQNCLKCGNMLRSDNEETYTCPEHGTFLDTDKWAFKSKAWAECDFVHVNLTSIHRQSDLEFIRILERCRLGKPLSPVDQNLLLHHDCDTTNAVHLFPTRDKVRGLNDREFRLLSTPIQTFDSHDDFKWNKEHPLLRSNGERRPDDHLCALDEHRFEPNIQLRKDMQVVLLVNLDLKSGLVNGSQGTIIDFVAHDDKRLPEQTGEHKGYKAAQLAKFVTRNARCKVWPVVRFTNGAEQTIFAHCTVNELGDSGPYSLLSRTQIPLAAAWAMTVHKSQGMTLSRVIVDLARSFEAGQEYVALSRAKSLDGLKAVGLGNHDRGPDEQVKEFLRGKFGIE